jgi:Thylakoid formation protein
LVGAKIKTVGEAFAEFTSELGYSVNPLYKNMVTDLVGTTHLILVNARFQRDPVWSLGMITALDLLLKNYPEPEIGQKITSALFKSVGLNEAEIKAEAQKITNWVSTASRGDIETALTGEGDSPVAAIARKIKGDQYWMYSRYFGIGLLKMMETVGIEMDKDEVYPIMEDWMSSKLGKSHLTACVSDCRMMCSRSGFNRLNYSGAHADPPLCSVRSSTIQADSDLFFKIREKLDMMETMMKEIEIREKKRMAERLEEKAEQALRAAEREEQMQKEIEAEAAKSRERVSSS